MQYMHAIIPYTFDCWANLVVHLHLLKISMEWLFKFAQVDVKAKWQLSIAMQRGIYVFASWDKERKVCGDGGQVVSVHAFYSDDPSFNLAEFNNFSVKLDYSRKRKQTKSGRGMPISATRENLWSAPFWAEGKEWMQSVRPDLAIFHHFSKILNCFGNFKSFISIWQNLEPTLTQIFMLGIVCISIVVDCQILKSHLAIRSHWIQFTFCTKPLLQYRTNFVLPKWSLNDHYFKICILWVQVKAWPRVMRSNLFGHSLSLSLSNLVIS